MYKRTPLHLAAANCDKEIVELLISKGADLHAKDEDNDAPLHWTVSESRDDIVGLLIAEGVDINSKGDYDSTALHQAARGDSVEFVKYLLSNGAKVNDLDVDGETPLDWAADEPEFPEIAAEISKVLREQGGKTGRELKSDGN